MNEISDELIQLLRKLEAGQSPFDGETGIPPGSKEDALLREAEYRCFIERALTDGTYWHRGFVLTEKGKRVLRASRA